MNALQAALLGIIQGLTEFLPLSSSGHLAITQHFFGLSAVEGIVSFDVALHFASVLAIVIVLFRDICQLFVTRRRMLLMLAIGSLPLSTRRT